MKTVPADSSIILQPRDLELLRDLFESRIMSLRHITAIHFDGHAEMAKKRVQRLKHAGYLDERPRQASEPSILFLTKMTFTVLKECGLLESYPQVSWTSLEKRIRVSKSTIEHELQVLDVRAALTASIGKTAAQIVGFQTWPALYQFTARRDNVPGAADVLVKPDGYIRIVEQIDGVTHSHAFFLEVDRSTETQDTLALKGAHYLTYYKSGAYAEWLGKSRAAFREYPFCVLMVLKTAERRNNTAGRLIQLNPPINRQVWLTTWKELSADPLGSIWVQPKEFMEVTKGTVFDPMVRRLNGLHQRRVAREEVVETVVRKKGLLRGN